MVRFIVITPHTEASFVAENLVITPRTETIIEAENLDQAVEIASVRYPAWLDVRYQNIENATEEINPVSA